MSKAKAQNCPICGSKALYGNPWHGPHVGCPDFDCRFYQIDFEEDLWNRIRIAPDDKEVKTREAILVSGLRSEVIEKADWMNPRYPDEIKEGE